MSALNRLFTEHPASVGETYLQHTGSALSFSRDLWLAALVCTIHAVLPFLFEKTGSAIVTRLYGRMVTHRDRRPKPASQAENYAD